MFITSYPPHPHPVPLSSLTLMVVPALLMCVRSGVTSWRAVTWSATTQKSLMYPSSGQAADEDAVTHVTHKGCAALLALSSLCMLACMLWAHFRKHICTRSHTHGHPPPPSIVRGRQSAHSQQRQIHSAWAVVAQSVVGPGPTACTPCCAPTAVPCLLSHKSHAASHSTDLQQAGMMRVSSQPSWPLSSY